MEGKKMFKRAFMGFLEKDVKSYIQDLTNRLKDKDDQIGELKRTIRELEGEKQDLIKQLKVMKEFFLEQQGVVLDKNVK